MNSTWGFGGGVFLDTKPSVGARTRLALYDITLSQFNDVVAQENRQPPPLPAALCLTESHIGAFRKGAQRTATLIPGKRYGTALYLGEVAGNPVVTFTSSRAPDSDPDATGDNLVPHPPSAAYQAVLERGLVESGCDPCDAHTYWQQRIDAQFNPLHLDQRAA